MGEKPQPRDEHPFYMFDHVKSQPEAFSEVAKRNRPLLAELSRAVVSARKVYLVGIGTSHHAAQIGGHLFRLYAPQVDCEVWHSYDFCFYGPRLAENDVVIGISHRGAKQFSLRALELAKSSGCTTAIITGKDAPPLLVEVDHAFQTVEQERSSAHTVSFVGSVATISQLVCLTSESESLANAIDQMPSALESGLAAEKQISEWAAEFQTSRRIWIVGAGPTETIAHETALKIKETSYLQVEGFSTEQLLHGPFQCCDADDLFVLLPFGPTHDRLLQVSQMIDDVGARYVFVTDAETARASSLADSSNVCVLPQVPAPFEALTSLIPMQLFTYHLALQRKTNPDGFRLEDARFAAALSRVKM